MNFLGCERWAHGVLTLTRITKITYVIVFLFAYCKQSHNKKFPFVYGANIVKKLSISTKKQHQTNIDKKKSVHS